MKTMKKLVSILMCCCFVFTTLACIDTPIEAATTKMSTPKITSITLTSANSIKIKWHKKSSVSGYTIYRKTSGGKYKKIATVKKTATSYTNKSLKYGKKYYYKIRTFKKSNGKTYYSNYSKAMSCKTISTLQFLR